jgi:hypothetical protein
MYPEQFHEYGNKISSFSEYIIFLTFLANSYMRAFYQTPLAYFP